MCFFYFLNLQTLCRGISTIGEHRLGRRGTPPYIFEAQKKTNKCFFLSKTNIYDNLSYHKLLLSEIISANSLYRLVTNN